MKVCARVCSQFKHQEVEGLGLKVVLKVDCRQEHLYSDHSRNTHGSHTAHVLVRLWPVLICLCGGSCLNTSISAATEYCTALSAIMSMTFTAYS